jgi:hypothetical protein
MLRVLANLRGFSTLNNGSKWTKNEEDMGVGNNV